MNRILGMVMAAGALAAGSASATVIGFDDIDASLGDVSLDALSPYRGFTWTNFFAYTSQPGFPGFNNGIVSGPNAAYSGGEEQSGPGIVPVVGTIQSSGLFDFTGAFIGSANYDNLSLTITGSRGGSALYSQTVTLETTGAQKFSFRFDGIDTLSFVAGTTGASRDPYGCGAFNCTQFTLDGVTLVSTSPPVPEPSSLALFCAGGGVAALGRLRQKLRKTVSVRQFG